jgi:hypothetical protein
MSGKKLPDHAVAVVHDKDAEGFANALSSLRNSGWKLSGHPFIKTYYENGLPVEDHFCQVLTRLDYLESRPVK